MSVTINPAALRSAQEEMAKRLLKAAAYFTAYHQEKLSISNPLTKCDTLFRVTYKRKDGKVMDARNYGLKAWALPIENRGYANSSKPGEYPRKRTGFGIANVVYGPDTIEKIIEEGLVIRVGIGRMAWYMLHLEVDKQRKGFQQTLADLRKPIKVILESKA